MHDKFNKSIIFLSHILLLSFLIFFCSGWMLETNRASSVLIRDAVDDGSGMTDISWDSSEAVDRYRLSKKWNAVVLSFYGSANNITCSDVEVWGYTNGGSAKLLWIGSITCGNADDDSGLKIADTITTTSDYTAGGATLLDNGGNDRHATLRFDAAENSHIVVLFPTVSAGNWSCRITGY